MSRLRNADAERKKPAPQRRLASSRQSSSSQPHPLDSAPRSTPFSSLNPWRPPRPPHFPGASSIIFSPTPTTRFVQTAPAGSGAAAGENGPASPKAAAVPATVPKRSFGQGPGTTATPRRGSGMSMGNATQADQTRGRGPRGDSERRRRAGAAAGAVGGSDPLSTEHGAEASPSLPASRMCASGRRRRYRHRIKPTSRLPALH